MEARIKITKEETKRNEYRNNEECVKWRRQDRTKINYAEGDKELNKEGEQSQWRYRAAVRKFPAVKLVHCVLLFLSRFETCFICEVSCHFLSEVTLRFQFLVKPSHGKVLQTGKRIAVQIMSMSVTGHTSGGHMLIRMCNLQVVCNRYVTPCIK